MNLWYSPYEFLSVGAGNSRGGSRSLSGCLLRVEVEPGLFGYSDLRPHTELGDENLETQLKSLKQQTPTALSERSLFFAKRDAEARVLKQNLFEDIIMHLPKTHWAGGLLKDCELANIEKALGAGHSHLKLKAGVETRLETRKVEEMVAVLRGKAQLRLDFNEALDKRGFDEWIGSLSAEALEVIDFVEDPMLFEAKHWLEVTEVPLAVDRHLDFASLKALPEAVAVVKPALLSAESLSFSEKRRVVFTNYMDHPVGECFAIREAANFYASGHSSEVCGLRTHHLYEKNAYSEVVEGAGAELRVPSEPGIGFGDLLEKEPWKAL